MAEVGLEALVALAVVYVAVVALVAVASFPWPRGPCVLECVVLPSAITLGRVPPRKEPRPARGACGLIFFSRGATGKSLGASVYTRKRLSRSERRRSASVILQRSSTAALVTHDRF